jgi:hypothetical protein
MLPLGTSDSEVFTMLKRLFLLAMLALIIFGSMFGVALLPDAIAQQWLVPGALAAPIGVSPIEVTAGDTFSTSFTQERLAVSVMVDSPDKTSSAPISSAPTSSVRRISDNIYAMQTFKEVLAVSKSECVTGIEKMGIANGPLYVWVVPKKHKACRNVPSAPLNVPAIDAKGSISYLGYGFFRFESLEEDLPLIANEYEVLDTEAIADGYVAIVRNRMRNWA